MLFLFIQTREPKKRHDLGGRRDRHEEVPHLLHQLRYWGSCSKRNSWNPEKCHPKLLQLLIWSQPGLAPLLSCRRYQDYNLIQLSHSCFPLQWKKPSAPSSPLSSPESSRSQTPEGASKRPRSVAVRSSTVGHTES